jgi:hypothetical protein
LSEKKSVSRVVAIALGVVCIILVASLAGTIAIIYSRDSTISSLQYENSNLQFQANELNSTANLSKIDLWQWGVNVSQPPASYSSWNFSAGYAGYLTVQVNPSQNSTNDIYVRVAWSYKKSVVSYDNTSYTTSVLDYDNTTNGGFVKCSILPCPNVTITLGNSDTLKGLTATMYIIYTY